MAPPSWIILSTDPRVSDTPLPNDFDLSLDVQAPPRVSFLTLSPRVCRKNDVGFIEALDPSGLLLVYTWPTYCVLDVPAATLSYRLPKKSPSCFHEYSKLGVIADPGGAAGAFVLADFHFIVGSAGDGDTLDRYWSRTHTWSTEVEGTRAWSTEVDGSPDQDGDDVPDEDWAFRDVISHDGKLWWIDPDVGLLTCCNPFREAPPPPFRFVHLPDVEGEERRDDSQFPDKFERGIVGRRYVQLSNAKFRCVQIRKPKGHACGAAPTFVTMRTLNDPETGDWTDSPEYKLSFADIRASDTFKAAGLPEDKDPVFALIHPKNPDVLYFFLHDYLFAFDMRAKKLIECQAHGLGNNPSSGDVCVWELPPDYAAAIAPAPPAPADSVEKNLKRKRGDTEAANRVQDGEPDGQDDALA